MSLVLVTGATGTIGSALVKELLEQGRPIRCLVRDVAKAKQLNLDGVEFVTGDLNNIESLESAFVGVSHVFHAGGMPEQWVSDDRLFDYVNVQGTQNMVEMALKHEIKKFIYVSTQDMFDFNSNPYDETMPTVMPLLSAYEKSKERAEELVENAVARGLPAIFIHPVAVYGPGAIQTSVLNQLLVDLLNNQIPVLLNGGMPVVLNTSLAKGMIAVESKAENGEHYLFSDEYQTLLDISQAMHLLDRNVVIPKVMPNLVAGAIANIGELIAGISGSKPLISKGELGVLRRKGRPSTAKIEKLIGWKATQFKDGLRQTMGWLQEKVND